MASTEPAPLTLLRVKRARTHSALDALHVHLPVKRQRRNGTEAEPLRFRRLPALTDIDMLGPSRVIDVHPSLLRAKGEEPSSTHPDTILYNGTPMSREFVDRDEFMFDFFADGNHPRLEHLLQDADDRNVAWLYANNLPIFDNDSSDEDLLSDSDDRSVDYPSTPELSDRASEDEWRGAERRLRRESQWSQDGDHTSEQDVDSDQWADYDGDSEQDGDNYAYDE